MDDEECRFSPLRVISVPNCSWADGGGYGGKCIRLKRKLHYVVAIETEVIVTETVRQKWNSQITIDLGRIQGYAWAFPKFDHLSIGHCLPLLKCERPEATPPGVLDSLNLVPTVYLNSAVLSSLCAKEKYRRCEADYTGRRRCWPSGSTYWGRIYNAIWVRILPSGHWKITTGWSAFIADYQVVLEKEILPNLKIAIWFPTLIFKLPSNRIRALNRDERIWRTGCDLLRVKTT